MQHQIGGQGLLDGVMISGKKGVATVRRKKDGKIDLKLDEIKKVNNIKKGFRSFPFLRGFFVIKSTIESGVLGFDIPSDILQELLSEKQIKKLKKIFSMTEKQLSNKFVVLMASIFSGLIFIVIPSIITYFFSILINSNIRSLVWLDVILTIIILIAYLVLLGKNEEINLMFKYHGAEHKSIFCYESGKELNIENIKKQKRFHVRCGTNFLFISFIIYSIIYLIFPITNLGIKIAFKILVIPFAGMMGYEIIEYISKSNSKFSKIVAFLGLRIQLLTTREPDDKQIEIAILAIKKAEGLEVEKTIRELLNEANQILKKANVESYILDAQLLMCHVLNQNKLSIMMNAFDFVQKEKEEEFMSFVEQRKNKYPMSYILKNVEFMGIDFYVEDGVLIPRPDTEILVEAVLKNIEKYEKLDICDLCCGSGAIGLTIAEYRSNVTVDLVDIESIPEKVTIKNIEIFEIADRAKFIHSNLFDELKNKKYDIIVSNPPYIKNSVINTLMDDVKNFEPHIALSGGDDGLIFYEKIIDDSFLYLKGKAILAFEIGHDQGEDVKMLMEKKGFENLVIIKDLAGLDRVVIGNLELE
ncbi:MAG: peptide chain release factor N(5)-glutamine methyltransferase [Sarcina sp.]